MSWLRSSFGLAVVLLATSCACIVRGQVPSTQETSPLSETVDLDGRALQKQIVWASQDSGAGAKFFGFRKAFELAAPVTRARIELFADERYLLWINGKYVLRGPARFNPKGPEYDTVDVGDRLVQGANLIAMVVMTRGHNGKMMLHPGGLTLKLDATLADGSRASVSTDQSWKWTDKTRYRPPIVEWGNVLDQADARVEDGDWTQTNYDDSAWKRVVTVDGGQWGPLSARRIPLLRERALEAKVIGDEKLPLTLMAGQAVHFDLGRLAQAYSVIDVDADAGTELNLVYGGIKYTDAGIKYFARQGKQNYISSDTHSFKEGVLSVKSGKATILGFKAVEVAYPFDCVGSFHCNDDRLNRIWQMGVNSLALLTEDAYVDCADRERTEWMDCDPPVFDVTRTAMAGPAVNGKPAYADARVLAEMLRRTALTQQPDGWVKAHTCSDRFDIHAYMEDRSCDWVEGARRYYESTQDHDLIKEIWPVVVTQLNWFLNHRTTRGLVKAREWEVWANPMAYQTCEGTGLNAFIYKALVDGAFLADAIGEKTDASRFAQAAQELGAAVNSVLWDEKDQTYYSGYYEDHEKILAAPKARKLNLKITDNLVEPTMYPALFALDQGIVPESRRASVSAYMLAHLDRSAQTMAHYYLFKQMYAKDQEDLDRVVLDKLATLFLPMADTGFHISWEGLRGGSKQHCYGLFPSYFLSAYVLGVRMDSPVWENRILVEPRLGGLTDAQGVVVTEFGPVSAAWKREALKLVFSLDIPEPAKAQLKLADGKPGTLNVDGKPAEGKQAGRYVVMELGAGKHRGEIEIQE